MSPWPAGTPAGIPTAPQPTCHCPMLSTRWPKGRWSPVHSLKASLRISMTLFTRAHMAARGKAEEKSTT